MSRQQRIPVFLSFLASLAMFASAGCIRPRYAHHSVDKYAFSKGTAHASGWLEPSPDPPVAKLSQIARGQRLVVTFSDFDRGLAFEAIITAGEGSLSMLVLSAGQPAGAAPEQRTLISPLLDIDPGLLVPAEDGEAYARDRETLERAIAADPNSGLAALAAHPLPLFASDSAELFGRIIRHSAANAALLKVALDFASRRREPGPALRGWIRSGGAGRLLEQLPGEKACDHDTALLLAADAFAGSIRGDREIIIRSVLGRADLSPADLSTILDGVTKAAASSSERRGIVRELVRHRAAEASVLAAAISTVDAVEFSADRREVLIAVLGAPAARTGTILADLVQSALTKLDYESDKEAVLVAIAKCPDAGEGVIKAIRAGLTGFKFDGPRTRVEAALPPR